MFCYLLFYTILPNKSIVIVKIVCEYLFLFHFKILVWILLCNAKLNGTTYSYSSSYVSRKLCFTPSILYATIASKLTFSTLLNIFPSTYGFTCFNVFISSFISTLFERFSSLLHVVQVSVNLQAHCIKCKSLYRHHDFISCSRIK